MRVSLCIVDILVIVQILQFLSVNLFKCHVYLKINSIECLYSEISISFFFQINCSQILQLFVCDAVKGEIQQFGSALVERGICTIFYLSSS